MSYRPWTVVSLVAICCAFAPTGATAQKTTATVPLASARLACTEVPLGTPLHVPANSACGCQRVSDTAPWLCARPQEELTRLVDHDTTDHLVTYLKLLATAAHVAGPAATPLVRFVWTGPDAEGKRVARSVVLDYGADEPTLELPGVTATAATPVGKRKYFDVLVAFDGAAKTPTPDAALPYLESLYTSGEKPNPLLEQLPSFIKQLGLLEAIGAGLGGTTLGGPSLQGSTLGERPPGNEKARMPDAVFKVYGPTLEHARADVAVRDWVITPATAAGVNTQANDIRDALVLGGARQSVCARNLANRQASAVGLASMCVASIGSLFSAEADRCRGAMNQALDTAYEAVVTDALACPPDQAPLGGDPVAAVDDAFRALAKGLGASVAQGQLSLTNVPREHFSLGLLTAVRFGTVHSSRPRVKVGDDDNVALDPLPRLATGVLANWHPFGYDPEKINTWNDRGSFKLSAGTTITPDFGVVVAAGYSPLKGLTIHVGYAIFLSNTPKNGVSIGQPVPADVGDDPFRSAPVRTPIWGLSYSFQ